MIKKIKSLGMLAFLMASLALAVQAHLRLDESNRDIPREIAQHVVPFQVEKLDNRTFATGFHVEVQGKVYILTNRHVCDANVSKIDPDKIKFGGVVERIIIIDNQHDLCLVTSSRDKGIKISFDPILSMDKVYLIGHPRGLPLVVREGRIIGETDEQHDWLDNKQIISQQISATAYGGNSGSPVINAKGELVGVLYAGIERYPHEPLIVPRAAVIDFLRRAGVLDYP